MGQGHTGALCTRARFGRRFNQSRRLLAPARAGATTGSLSPSAVARLFTQPPQHEATNAAPSRQLNRVLYPTRQREWDAQIARARERFREAHRANVLRAQVAARQEANAMSAYLGELEAAHGATPDSLEWIEWIREFIARIDPLTSPPTMPAEPEIAAEDLKPFLPRGVSPAAPAESFTTRATTSKPRSAAKRPRAHLDAAIKRRRVRKFGHAGLQGNREPCPEAWPANRVAPARPTAAPTFVLIVSAGRRRDTPNGLRPRRAG
jgi:hypothetical protein